MSDSSWRERKGIEVMENNWRGVLFKAVIIAAIAYPQVISIDSECAKTTSKPYLALILVKAHVRHSYFKLPDSSNRHMHSPESKAWFVSESLNYACCRLSSAMRSAYACLYPMQSAPHNGSFAVNFVAQSD